MKFLREERRKLETISQSEYERRSKIAIENQPIRKEVSLRDIEVVKDGVLSYKGSFIGLSENALKDLCKIVGLPMGFEKTFTKNFGENARKQLLSKLKVATAVNKNTPNVTLILNPSTRTIEAIHTSKNRLISHTAFLDTATSLIDRYNLDVNNFTTNFDGSLLINTSSPKNQFGVKGLKDEDFLGGITFTNDLKNGFSVSPFLYRMICINGMIGNGFEETLKLGGLEPKKSEDFFVQLNQLAERNFKPAGLDERIRVAMNTQASLYEMRDVHELLSVHSKEKPHTLEKWLPYVETNQAFIDAKIDPILFSDEQKKRARTGTSVWDMINGITHFATHDNGFKISDESRRIMQRKAGDLLTKKVYDMQNSVPSPFKLIGV